jgi:hypothetical protein
MCNINNYNHIIFATMTLLIGILLALDYALFKSEKL